MKTSCFDAVVNFPPPERTKRLNARILFQGMALPVSFYYYGVAQKDKGLFFVQAQTRRSLWLKWKDRFIAERSGAKEALGEGEVLIPFSEKISRKKVKKRIEFLSRLQGDKKEMLFALAQDKGLEGLRVKEMMVFSSLKEFALGRLSQELEVEGKIRILSFAPLFILAQESLDFLSQKILVFLESFHQKHPEQMGASLERMKRRFDLQPRILHLALKHLQHAGKIKEIDGKFFLSSFRVILSSEEERILKELEEMCLRGEFRLASLRDIQKRFHLSLSRLNKMLAFLIERKKIVQGKDGFIVHSRWLDDVIWQIKKSGKKELTVSDFKKMTGLTRKYAIPLLELLDQMRVTRRKGPLREIL